MKVGVLGSGEVAKVLASGFLKHGHEVMMGTRETRFRRRLRLDTYSHYPKHARAIREWRERSAL